jgi:hypothetical protein
MVQVSSQKKKQNFSQKENFKKRFEHWVLFDLIVARTAPPPPHPMGFCAFFFGFF